VQEVLAFIRSSKRGVIRRGRRGGGGGMADSEEAG
jgi:hypothetical protein